MSGKQKFSCRNWVIEFSCPDCEHTFNGTEFAKGGKNCSECGRQLVFPTGGILDTDLQRKINALGLLIIDETAYNKYLRPYEETYKRAKIDINRIKYYKLYGKEHMLYSVKYIERTPMEELLKADKANAILIGKG
jgi:ribosomal protein S27E